MTADPGDTIFTNLLPPPLFSKVILSFYRLTPCTQPFIYPFRDTTSRHYAHCLCLFSTISLTPSFKNLMPISLYEDVLDSYSCGISVRMALETRQLLLPIALCYRHMYTVGFWIVGEYSRRRDQLAPSDSESRRSIGSHRRHPVPHRGKNPVRQCNSLLVSLSTRAVGGFRVSPSTDSSTQRQVVRNIIAGPSYHSLFNISRFRAGEKNLLTTTRPPLRGTSRNRVSFSTFTRRCFQFITPWRPRPPTNGNLTRHILTLESQFARS